MAITAAQRQRKINKLHRVRSELSVEARNTSLSATERASLARASDALRAAIDTMEGTASLLRAHLPQ